MCQLKRFTILFLYSSNLLIFSVTLFSNTKVQTNYIVIRHLKHLMYFKIKFLTNATFSNSFFGVNLLKSQVSDFHTKNLFRETTS